MKKTNKILAIILAILMIISIVPITSNAATYSGACGENATWTYDDITCTLTISGTGDMHDFEYSNRPWESYAKKIKEVIIYDGITSIGAYAFRGCYNVTMIAIPDSITKIGKYGIYACKRLTNIELSDKITLIDEWTFAYCESLTNITIPQGVISIGDYAFSDCYNLVSVTIPDSVTTIGECAFQYCESITNISIPDSLTTIGETAFLKCMSITDITVDNNNQCFSSDEYGVLFNKDKTTLIQYPIGNIRASYTIPDSVITVNDFAFYHSENLTKIAMPNSVTIIGDDAFAFCYNLVDFKIGNSVTTIGEWAFIECYSLTSITIPDSVIAIDGGAFHYCYNLTTVTIGKGVTTIGRAIFYMCNSLATIIIPDSVVSIDTAAFYECDNLKDVYFTGTKEQWKAISIGGSNDPLLKATIHYNYHVHEYNPILTPPTCTEQGYTTYTCECGDSYIDDYVDALGHTEEIIPAVAPTCTETGLTEGAKCSVCGETLTEQETVDALGHTPSTAVEENYVAPTCTENGSKDVVVYCSVCGKRISRETVILQATGHADNDGDGYCDADNNLLDPSVECDHCCHKEGILGFIWRIINVFNRLFSLNKTCDCGIVHY